MGKGLVGKEIRFRFQFEKTLDSERPIELFQKEEHAAVDRIQFLTWLAENAWIGRACLAILQIKCRSTLCLEIAQKIIRRGKK